MTLYAFYRLTDYRLTDYMYDFVQEQSWDCFRRYVYACMRYAAHDSVAFTLSDAIHKNLSASVDIAVDDYMHEL
jgi:hypothetical protein